MKILDPQAALLTTTEVHQFLKASKPRPAEKRIGAYSSVNVHNYTVVRQDLETYIQATTPYVLEQPPSESWMKDLLQKLKKYQLTKTEVFALINLGVGLNESPSAAVAEEGESYDVVNGDEDQTKHQGAGATETEGGGEEEVAVESTLDQMLFGLVVEEADERFSGDEGETRVAEILSILKGTITGIKNGTAEKAVNGT